MDRRRVVRFAFRLILAAVTASAALLLAPAVRAQQSFQRFFPLLIDLQGWSGNKPDGFAVELPGNSMITATREYRRGEARLNAQVVTGPAAQGATAATRANVNVETSDAHMRTATIDGLPVAISYSIKDKSGIILVALGANAMFSMSFKGLGEDEALALARQFDWKRIQGLVPK